MKESIYFCAIVLLSGWALGFALAKAMGNFKSPSAKALALSLSAVSIPSIAAFSLASESERAALLSQFGGPFDLKYLFLSVLIPIVIAAAGHICGAFTLNRERASLLPSRNIAMRTLSFLPICLLWGLLEEIGWRGYLNLRLAAQMPLLAASLTVGAVWTLWHAPQMFFNSQLQRSFQGRIFTGILLWSTQCILLATLFGILQNKTGSFLYPTIAHALLNLLGSMSDQILGDSRDGVITGTSGVPAAIASILLLVSLM